MAAPGARSAVAQAPGVDAPRKKRIVFVDDEPDLLESLRDAMHRHRHIWAVVLASGGDAALEALAEEPADVIVADMQMPGMAELSRLIARSCALRELTRECEAFRRTAAATSLPSRPGVHSALSSPLLDAALSDIRTDTVRTLRLRPDRTRAAARELVP